MGYWHKMENRRKFLCDFAAEAGFDPLVPSNWSFITFEQVVAKKVHSTIGIQQLELKTL